MRKHYVSVATTAPVIVRDGISDTYEIEIKFDGAPDEDHAKAVNTRIGEIEKVRTAEVVFSRILDVTTTRHVLTLPRLPPIVYVVTDIVWESYPGKTEKIAE